MELIGAILVFLGFVCAGLAAGIFWVLVRLAQSRDEQHAEAMARAEEHHRALCNQLTAAMERGHLLAAGLAAEVRAMTAAHRNDLRLAARLPALRVPGEKPPQQERAERPPPSSTTARTTPATPANTNANATSAAQPAAPIASRMTDEDATPPSGWSLEQIRAHTARPDPTETGPQTDSDQLEAWLRTPESDEPIPDFVERALEQPFEVDLSKYAEVELSPDFTDRVVKSLAERRARESEQGESGA